MSMKDFLKQESEKYASDFEGFSTIAKVIVAPGFQVGNFGDGSNKLFTYTKAGEGDKAKADAVSYQKDIGSKFGPTFGIALTILKDHILLGPQFKKDWEQHIRAWESMDNLSKFSAEQQAQLQNVTALPFDIFISVDGEIPFGEEMWARLVQVTDEWQEMQVKLGRRTPNTYTSKQDGQEKTGKHQVYVVKEIFKSEAEAKAAADKIEASRAAKNENPFSEKATIRYKSVTGGEADTIKNIRANAGDISVWLWKAFKGEALTGYKLPEFEVTGANQAIIDKSTDGTNLLWQPGLTIPPQLLEYLGEIWDMESSDILLLQSEVPF